VGKFAASVGHQYPSTVGSSNYTVPPMFFRLVLPLFLKKNLVSFVFYKGNTGLFQKLTEVEIKLVISLSHWLAGWVSAFQLSVFISVMIERQKTAKSVGFELSVVRTEVVMRSLMHFKYTVHKSNG